MASVEKPAREDFAGKVKALRTSLGMAYQQDLADALGVRQSLVSKWESGRNEPSAANYAKLAHMAREEGLNRFFVNRAIELAPGMKSLFDDARAREEAARMDEGRKPKRATRRSYAEVPLLRDAIAAGAPRLVRDHDYDEVLTLPPAWVPHPEHTRAVPVAGDSMSPVVNEGFIVVVDTYTQEPRDLVGALVAAQDPEGGVTVKWLRKVGREFILVAQHTSPRHNPILVREDPRWRIIGKVLFWIGKPD